MFVPEEVSLNYVEDGMGREVDRCWGRGGVQVLGTSRCPGAGDEQVSRCWGRGGGQVLGTRRWTGAGDEGWTGVGDEEVDRCWGRGVDRCWGRGGGEEDGVGVDEYGKMQ